MAVRARFVSDRVHQSLVEDETISFSARSHFELLGGWITSEKVRVDHFDVATFVHGFCHLVNHILPHDLVIELFRTTY